MLFASYLFVFACMRLGMISLFMMCARTSEWLPNLRCMPLPEAFKNPSVDI